MLMDNQQIVNDQLVNQPANQLAGQPQSHHLNVVLIILIVLIVILGIVNAFIFLGSQGFFSGTPQTYPCDDITSRKPATDLTKEEAVSALSTMNEPGHTPCGFIDSALLAKGEDKTYFLEYSYGNPGDIRGVDYQVSDFDQYQLNIEPVDDSYTIVTATENDSIVADQPIGIAFHQDYLNYSPLESSSNNGQSSTNSQIRFVDTTESFVKKALPIVYLTRFGSTILSNTYSYSFSNDDKYISLSTFNIVVGTNMMAIMDPSPDNVPYTIDILTVKCRVDKKTGEFTWVEDESGRRETTLNSYPLTEAEIKSLMP